MDENTHRNYYIHNNTNNNNNEQMQRQHEIEKPLPPPPPPHNTEYTEQYYHNKKQHIHNNSNSNIVDKQPLKLHRLQTHHIQQQQQLPGKFNTIGPSSSSLHKLNDISDNDLSTQFHTNNLLSGRCFSNSLNNFTDHFNHNHLHHHHAQPHSNHLHDHHQQQHHHHHNHHSHHPHQHQHQHSSTMQPQIHHSHGHYINDNNNLPYTVQYPDYNLSLHALGSSGCGCDNGIIGGGGGGGAGCNRPDCIVGNSLNNSYNIINNNNNVGGLYTSATTHSTILDGSNSGIIANDNGGFETIHGKGGGSGALYNGKAQQQQQQDNSIPWRHRQCPSVNSNSSGTSFTKWDPTRHWLAVTSILLIVGAAGVAVPLALRVTAGAPFEERLQIATQLLNSVPLIDGHNDLPWNIRQFIHNKLNNFNFDTNLKEVQPWSKSKWSHTDLVRLKKGQISAQFWAAYVPCETKFSEAVRMTLEQIDVIFRITEKYSPQLTSCTSVIDIIEAHKNHQLCSLTGVEGGHSLGGSLGVLRTYYTLGVRYMTLTSTCHTPWADSSVADAPKYEVKHGGLTSFGKIIIREMNRLGMIVDLSHVSVATMRDALSVSEAPVIFSHSSAFELCNSNRNVPDSIIELIVKNGGLVMINFFSKFLTCTENATVHNAIAHINHIKKVAGVDYVGLGSGFDGINYVPTGLEDVSTYPFLFAELLGNGWTIEELTKLAGENFLRVLRKVEEIRDKKKLAGVLPFEDILQVRGGQGTSSSSSYNNCTNISS